MAGTAPALSQAERDAIYYKQEALKAFRERDEIKRSLEAAGGPAVFWRTQAKMLAAKHGDALRRVEGLRSAEHEQRLKAIDFSEQLDGLTSTIATHKFALWVLWNDLEDDQPAKRRLWELWTALG